MALPFAPDGLGLTSAVRMLPMPLDRPPVTVASSVCCARSSWRPSAALAAAAEPEIAARFDAACSGGVTVGRRKGATLNGAGWRPCR